MVLRAHGCSHLDHRCCRLSLHRVDRPAPSKAETEKTESVTLPTCSTASLRRPAAADPSGREVHACFRCVGGRGQIDDAAASIIAFALRQSGSEASSRRHGEKVSDDGKEGSVTIHLICYASHPSEAVRRYTLRQADSARRRRAGPPSRHRLRRRPCARAVDPRRRRPRRHLRRPYRRALQARGPTTKALDRFVGQQSEESDRRHAAASAHAAEPAVTARAERMIETATERRRLGCAS